MSEQSLNPLTLPLQGLQVIEASAGTGKTYTLAALYVRLVLGHGRSQRGLTPPEILVMTFTEAATAELRDRIRVRLTQASQAFREDAFLTDAFLKDLKSDIDSSEWPRCAAQLDAAAQWMDEAAIYTIHGWSSRMLRQHAFDSSSLFEQSTVDDSQALRLQVAADYWREWYYGFDDTQIQAVLKIADTPTSLVNKLLPIWRVQERSLPENVQASTLNKNRLDNLPTPLKILEQWSLAKTHVHELQMQAQALWSAHGSDLIEQLRLAMENDLNGNSYKAALRDSYIEQLIAWMQGDGLDPKVAVKFTLRELCAKTKASRPKPEDSTGAFAAMQAWIDALNDTPSPQEALLAHAAQDIAQRYERIKQQRGQFDFSDLLTRLFSALQLPNSRLPQAIREQYPVALVDEFQDTDPWQWGALSKIYLHHHDAGVGLLLIGDPKQAIYSFRGADLKTYIAAREQAQAVHRYIRDLFVEKDAIIGDQLRLLYGGSVKAANASDLFGMPDVDGGLVGGASLKADEFLGICAAAR